ncbi:hypothetical protein BU24DRAFT_349084 [Aaosphaeria arxii CBS 175.79]|uniref:F-box domain-containing protein n=1 Tax=Aaosphaeria arxii CBS 175.79 TaxID=1450172 RepID=A0A6A5XPL2_9PLEO|nr:uncharacterized protein BU24DRAFT_349084 [Aaosphaeria arxii CBS 175.79]KAF2014883.1 hypothetical protein BU24DRAFT_349084 [Aaosphaeria arxii CBS 175.79]
MPGLTSAIRSSEALSKERLPITAPHHGWFTSPARSHASSGNGRELPLHLIALILSHLDDAADLARVTRTSRVFYYMTLPRLYEHVTLRSYSELRYVNGRPEGYGNGSPFAMGLNTLVSRNFTDYVQTFRVVGEWREHDVDDYSKGRVPDNSMMLQLALRAALDKMKNLRSFAWELNTKPLQTVYQSIMSKPSITSLTLRFPTKRIPRPTTLIPPLPNLITLVVYDIDPLCSPDDISLLLVRATKLENLKMHWSPRMRESGEESVNLINYFGRCIAAKQNLPVKRMALYNMYARHSGGDFDHATDPAALEEVTMINCMGSSDPMTVFLDDTWRLNGPNEVPPNLKMMKGDFVDSQHVAMLGKFHGLRALYLISKRKSSKPSSIAPTPTTPSMTSPGTSATSTPITEHQCKSLAGDYLAVIQSNHRNIRHLLLPDNWQLSEDTLFKLCQNCPDLEQLAFSCGVPPLESLRQIIGLCKNLTALRLLVRPGSELAEKLDSMDAEMHQFAFATELWHPEYMSLKYVGLGDRLFYRLGPVVYPPKSMNGNIPPGQENSMNAKRYGPMRMMHRIEWEDIKHVEIFGMDTTEFDPSFP